MATNVFIRAVRFKTPTATGSFDITGSLGGITPKAVMFILGYHDGAASETTESVFAGMSYGFSDGTRNRAINGRSQDAQATANNGKCAQDNVSWWQQDQNGIVIAQAVVTSFIADGVRLSIQTANATQFEGTAIFFGGTDLSAYVADTGSLGAGAGTTTVSGVGFLADAVIFAGAHVAFNNFDVPVVTMELCLGAANRSPAQQQCLSWAELSGAAGGAPTARLVSTAAIAAISPTDGTLTFTGTVGNFGSNGFDVVRSATSANTAYAFLALKLGTLRASVFTHTTPTATGDQAVTTPGWTPQLAMLWGSNLEAIDTSAFDTQLAGGHNVSVFDAGNKSLSAITRISSVSNPSVDKSLYTTKALQTSNGLSEAAVVATNSGFTTTGWTFNYTSVEANAKKLVGLAFELGDIIASPVGFTFADFHDTTYNDWVIGSGIGADYSSYLYTYYQATDDEMYYMQAPYVYVFLQNQTPNTATNPTRTKALLFRGAWDWANATASGHFSHQENCYNYRHDHLIAVSRKKVRGKGRVLQLRFDSSPGLDFEILGWGLPIGKNSDP